MSDFTVKALRSSIPKNSFSPLFQGRFLQKKPLHTDQKSPFLQTFASVASSQRVVSESISVRSNLGPSGTHAVHPQLDLRTCLYNFVCSMCCLISLPQAAQRPTSVVLHGGDVDQSPYGPSLELLPTWPGSRSCSHDLDEKHLRCFRIWMINKHIKHC